MRRALAGLPVVLLLGCSPSPPVDAGAGPASSPSGANEAAGANGAAGAPTDFRVRLDAEQTPTADPDGRPLVRWRTDWTLSWQAPPGAREHAVWFGTNEGAGTTPRRTVDVPELRLTAAAGTSPPDRLELDRDTGLLFTSSQLLVSVAARNADGTYGPRSAWFPVGDAPEDGRPVGTALTGHGAGG